MKTAVYGRIFFGASAVLFGVIALMWRDSDTWQTLQEIWKLPFGAIIGGCLMAAQIGGGIGMQYPRTTRLASVVLGVVYLLFSLACIPGIIAATNIYDRYGGSFFLFFSLLCGAMALYAATEANAARAAAFSRLARALDSESVPSRLLWVRYFFLVRLPPLFPSGFRPARCSGRYSRPLRLRWRPLPFSSIARHG
jgi:hypothetical protein